MLLVVASGLVAVVFSGRRKASELLTGGEGRARAEVRDVRAHGLTHL